MRDLYNVRSMLNSYIPTVLASWLLNNNIHISNYIKEPGQRWSWRPASTCHVFDIRENQLTLSRIQCYAVMETECTERVHPVHPRYQIGLRLRWYLVPSLEMYSRWSPQNSSLPPRNKSLPTPPTHAFLLFRPMPISCRSCLLASPTPISLSPSFLPLQPHRLPGLKRHGMPFIVFPKSTIITYHDDTVTTTMLMRRGRGFTHPSHPPLVSRPTPFGLLV